MLDDADCVACAQIGGKRPPRGGIVYQDELWAFYLRSKPLLVCGQGFLVLKRHCEDIGLLTPLEAAALGPLMQLTRRAYEAVLQPERVHFGLYAEEVRHVHLHVLPRMPGMPAGNIPVTLLGVWYGLLARFHLKQAHSDASVAQLARELRTAFHALRESD